MMWNDTETQDEFASPRRGAGSEDAHPSYSGRWTAVGMLLFGVVMVGIMAGYFELSTRPFRPLVMEIAQRYPGSQPNVKSGNPKPREPGSPVTFRLTVRVDPADFNPTADVVRSEQRARELMSLTNDFVDLSEYDQIELYLIQRDPEQEDRYWEKSGTFQEWMEDLGSE